MWPQITYLVLVAFGLLYTAHMHGKPRDDWNFWSSAISTVIVLALLYMGGFFDGLLGG